MAENSTNAEVIQAWLVSTSSERLGIESHEIDFREPFASYRLGSAEAVIGEVPLDRFHQHGFCDPDPVFKRRMFNEE